MGRKIKGLILGLLLWVAFSINTIAANHVQTIEIQAIIHADGSMDIIQSWEGNFEEGTEVYFPLHGHDQLTIRDLQVSDQRGPYETVAEWDLDWDFDEKARRSGIHHTDGGVEICFGISQYGQNHYTIQYTLEHVVASYHDRDGVNFRFVSDQMNTTPTNVTVLIQLADGTPITNAIADIWGFGFLGQVGFGEGKLFAYTEEPLAKDNHVTLLFSMDKGILSPARQGEGSFEEVKDRAFAGSDYGNPEAGQEVSLWEILLGLLCAPSMGDNLAVKVRCGLGSGNH